jgi:hypothetical protein
MTTVNSLSGGKSSSYMAVHYPADVNVFACVCIDFPKAAPKDPAVLKYCLDKLNGNFIASAESEKTLRIMMQLEQLIGKEIVWVRGKSFDQIIDQAGCLPTWARRFCTTDMKILPIFEYVYFNHGVVRERIGYRYDESQRAYKTERDETVMELINLFGDIDQVRSHIKKKWRKTESIMTDYPASTNTFGDKRRNLTDILWAYKEYPMMDDRIDRIEVLRWWAANHSEFDFPPESNCAGCHHKSPEVIRNQFVTEPEIMEWFVLQESKKTFAGKKQNVTWHDDQISYERKRDMSFTELLQLGGSGSCNAGYCTD